MSDTTNSNYKPPLYRGHPIPLTSLTEDSFEDFVYQTLVILGEQKGFQVQSGRQPSGDQGFDCTAKTQSGSLVCIQCKRYTDTLYTDTVAKEIIKVALDGVLNTSTPKQHYIITCGEVAGKLRRQLRQSHYEDLKEKCKELLDSPDFANLIRKVQDRSISPFETIVQYLDSLDSFFVWSGVDFENEMSVIWSKLTSILEKHFSLELAFKEHPRPDFNLSDYIHSIDKSSSHLVPLQYQQSNLPEKLSYLGELENHTRVVFSNATLISHLQHGKKIIISSSGGSGKSCSLAIIENELIQQTNDIKFIPVKISLRSYSRNTLDQTIKKRLGISYGSWKSLPFKFIFLFDALDEMLQHDTQAFIDELEDVTKGYSFVITLRNTGLNIETSLTSISFCISILPLSYRSAFEIAKHALDDNILEGFYSAYRERLNSIGYNSLSSPFALNLTVQYYKENKRLPDNIEELLDHWVNSKISHDAKKVNNTNNKVNKIPTKFIREAFALLLYKSRIDNNLSFIPKNSYDGILMDVYDKLKSSKSYISRYLDFSEFTDIILHYELLKLGEDNFYSTPHPIISDYLISKLFAENWRKHSEKHLINSLQDVWYFSSNHINKKDHVDFMQSILSFDLILGAQVSRKLGGECISIAENELLLNEQSEKIITRGQAISALGILGTDASLNRLRSDTNLLDEHHLWLRLRSLAAYGDQDILRKVLKEKEMEAQMPFKASGGNYDIWFSAPPIVLTNIARSRLNVWLTDKNLPLCMCLEIIELYGDSYDIKILLTVINETENEKEFHHAAKAIFIIDSKSLITGLKEITKNYHRFSYEAKKILLQLGIKSDIHDEFTFLIEQSKKNEAEIANQNTIIFLDKLADFLCNFELTEDQTNVLVSTYNSLNFSQDFYYYDLLWSLASKMKLSKFIPIAESVFENKNPDNIHRAINYLSHMDAKNISPEFSRAIDQYYCELEDSSYGTKSYYAKYYLNQGRKDRAHEIITKSITEILIKIESNTINRDEYISCGNLWKVFCFLDINIAHDLALPEPISLKFLLLDTNTSNHEYRAIKKLILSKLNIATIENYIKEIKDNSVRVYVIAYLLESNLISNQTQYLKNHLPNLLAHHMFHSVIEKVCDRIWGDELAMFFLSCFVEQEWNPVTAQMFNKLTNFFAEKFTEEQLLAFESKREKPINKLIERIYRIWLEVNGVVYRDN